MTSDVTVALIGVSATAIGWLVLSHLDRVKEDRRRRLEKQLEYATRQIEEFYGPLFNLANQIFLANQVKEDILSATDASGHSKLNEDQSRSVDDFFQREHFVQLHQEINSILKHKLHLIHDAKIPPSFSVYLLHALQERDQRQLWEQRHIDTSFVKGTPWPPKFYDDLKTGLARAMAEYEEALGNLKHKPSVATARASAAHRARGSSRAKRARVCAAACSARTSCSRC